MAEHAEGRRLPPLQTLIAGGLVGLGILLWMLVSKGFIIVAGIGAFGPGILRELGLLADQDEFQRQAAHRAGYHAYLFGGLATVLILTAMDWPRIGLEADTEWIRLILVVLWLSWLFSALLAYWGPKRTTSGVLLTFGSFWAVFVLAHLGDASWPANRAEWILAVQGFLAGTMILTPFFLLAWTAHRWPRATGVALLAFGLLFVVVFRPWRGGTSVQIASGLLTGTALIVPLVACGVALLKWDDPENAG